MSEQIYVNKNGFKCVVSQLMKTDGKDPQEHEAAMRNGADVSKLPTKVTF
jgi:hypothetical protein